jgi:SAM-dependent methyltransferase
MTLLDDKLRDRRIARAISLIPDGARVLDVGCRDGHLLRVLGPKLTDGLGIDPDLPGEVTESRFRLVPGWFPADLPTDAGTFDAIVMLALFEHIPPDEQPKLVETCRELLNPGGTVILTIPSKQVDAILDVLEKVKLVQDDSIHQHYGFDAKRDTEPLFHQAGFETVVRKSFQLGLNNLFQFRAA